MLRQAWVRSDLRLRAWRGGAGYACKRGRWGRMEAKTRRNARRVLCLRKSCSEASDSGIAALRRLQCSCYRVEGRVMLGRQVRGVGLGAVLDRAD